jgi:L-aspartate oxidase
VFLDMTKRSRAYLSRRFPNIWRHLSALGLDMSKTPIPVVPAAHFFCGGVQTDADGATALPGLFAIGETAHTGLHGANRLASNSLLEGCVFAHRAFSRIRGQWQDIRRERLPPAPRWNSGKAVPSDEAVVVRQDWDEVRRLMWNYVGIVRTDRRLKSALERLRVIRREVETYYRKFLLTRDLIELRNIAILGELLVVSALSRRESRGLHYTLDRPKPVEAQRRDTWVGRRGARSLDCVQWKA